MCRQRLIHFSLLALAVTAASPAAAYIGPGAGAGTIAVVLGILAAIGMAFFAVLWYPVKRLLKGRKKAEVAGDPPAQDGTTGE